MIPMLRVLSRAYLRGMCVRSLLLGLRSVVAAAGSGHKNGPSGPGRDAWMSSRGARAIGSESPWLVTSLMASRAQAARAHRRRRGNIAEPRRSARPRIARRDGLPKRRSAAGGRRFEAVLQDVRRRLPTVMREGLVGLRHAVDVVLALVRGALLGLRVEQLVGEPLGHRLLAALARELHEP